MTGWDASGYNISSKLQYDSGKDLWDMICQNHIFKNGDSLLDIGCGNGNYIIDVLEQIPQITHACGIDMSEEMLNIAKAKCQKRKIKHFEFIHQDVAIFNPQLKNKFNIAYSNYCLHWVGNKILALNNILEYLQPNGILALKIAQPGSVRMALYLMSKEAKWKKFNFLKNYVNHNIESYDPLSYETNFYKNYFDKSNIELIKYELDLYTYKFTNSEEMCNFIRYGIIPFTIPDNLAEDFVNSFIKVSESINDYSKNQIWLTAIDIVGKKIS